jgi:hypothetical protein
MNEFQISLLIGLVITGAISSRLPRAWLWLACGAASFVFSTAYARYGLPHAPAFTLACDSSICLAVYFFGVEKWEISGIYRIFQASVLISLFRLSNIIVDQWVYIVALEILNWAALLLVGGTAILDRARAHEGYSGWNWDPHLHRSNLALRRTRQTQPFHKVRR